MKASRGEPQAFLDAAVAYDGNDCLLWPFALTDKGYGQLRVNQGGARKVQYAHRIVLERTQGTAPEGMVAAHAPLVCHSRSCVNPRHLRWATLSENQADKHLDGTAPTKLADDAVEFVRQHEASMDRETLAAMFGVHVMTVWRAQRGETYGHVTVRPPNPRERRYAPRPRDPQG